MLNYNNYLLSKLLFYSQIWIINIWLRFSATKLRFGRQTLVNKERNKDKIE